MSTSTQTRLEMRPVTARLRRHVPALGYLQNSGRRPFDAPSGTQMIDGCIEAMTSYICTGMANRGAQSATGERTEDILVQARTEMSHLVHGDGYRVVFGQNMTSLNFALAHAVTRLKDRRGASVLLSELEHFGNVDPWSRNFEAAGGDVGWLTVDPETLRLDRDAMNHEFSSRSVDVVAITLASNAIGTIPDVAEIAEIARANGALVAVDGVQAIFDQQVDLRAIRPDLFLCSAYKFYGPHLGVALVREELAEALKPFKVTPATEVGPSKFETGTQNHEAIAGLVGTFDALAGLVDGSGGRGAREAIGILSEGQGETAAWIESQLRGIDGIDVYRATADSGLIAPTVAFRIAGQPPAVSGARLCSAGFFVNHGDHYASALARRLGVTDGGWVRAGVAGYTTPTEAEGLVEAIAQLKEEA